MKQQKRGFALSKTLSAPVSEWFDIQVPQGRNNLKATVRSMPRFRSIKLLHMFHLLHIIRAEAPMSSPANLYRQSPPTAQEAALARDSGRRLCRYARQNHPLALRVADAEQEMPLELPAGAVALLMEILEAMAAGQGVSLIPENAELTTVQAAEILNVSRPYLIKLLEERALPHRKVGKHRRIRMEDVMAYKDRIDQEREAVLDELVADAQQNDMGYSPR
jgi:excisionase family DNA binding protein